MPMKPHGITVQLEVRTQSGTDGFNRPVYSSEYVTVDDVVVGSPTADERNDTLTLTGKHIEYWIGIPKGDEHDWVDKELILPAPFSCTVRTFGFVQTAPQDLLPLRWGARVMAERYG